MIRFTFIVDYLGGTYLQQVLADDVEAALVVWATGLREGDIGKVRGKLLEHARRKFLDNQPVPITGLTAVWCISALVRDELMLVHIVEGPIGPTAPISDT